MKRHSMRRGQLKTGFSILEMMFATTILVVGLVAVAQLVPASLLLNLRNRNDSAALVFAQRELDQMLAQPLSANTFTDAEGNVCSLGNPAATNQVQPASSYIVPYNNQMVINFGVSPVANFSFTYQDPSDPTGTTYEVRWAVIVTGISGRVSSKRFVLGVRQVGGNGFFQPVTIDTIVEQ